MVILHYTGMADAAASRARLCDPAYEVSAHWLIDRDGTAEALVPETERAWHAGASWWQGATDINSRSIGIEVQNTGAEPYPAPQMAALRRLLTDVMDRWSIPPARVLGHSDVAPARKVDPGGRFDWRGLAAEGLALWPGPGEGDPDGLDVALVAMGYDPRIDPSTRLAAFRRRVRPWGEGAPTPREAGMAADFCARMAVDPVAAAT